MSGSGSRAPFDAFFLPAGRGERFCIFHPAVGAPLGSVLYLHPFAEEMNKSRRMAALQARAFAAAGISVLQIDLMGCGDSAGDFADGSWALWINDVVAAVGWVRERTGLLPFLWGMRSGCLVACAALARLPDIAELVFWQPVISGRQHLQQFLRLRVAGDLIGGAGAKRTGTSELRAELESGGTLDIAGYALSPAIALGLDAADLAPRATRTRVAWLEVSGSEPPAISPASEMRMTAWRAEGSEVAATAVAGLPFWQTQEIAECQPLIDATTAAVLRWDP
jgi:exosortase A-associated hydrolase 2